MGKYYEGEVLQGVFALLYQKGRRENMGERERERKRQIPYNLKLSKILNVGPY